MSNTDELTDAELQRIHGVTTALRDAGLTVGFDTDDYDSDFDAHVAEGHETLRAEDLGAYFVVAHRSGRTDYSGSVCIDDPTAAAHVHIEMLAAHFRTVFESLPEVDASTLMDAVVSEAVSIEEYEGDADE